MRSARNYRPSVEDGNRNFEITAIDLPVSEPLTEDMVRALADPDDPLVAISRPEVVSAKACAQATKALKRRRQMLYGGPAAETLATRLGESAWDFRYNGHDHRQPDSAENWQLYFDAVAEWDRERESLLGKIFGVDPLEIMVNQVTTALGVPVERAVHPRFGRKMGAGLIRGGAPLPHFDWARLDLGFDAIGHIGLVMVLNASPNAVQRVWRGQAEPDGQGNYNLPAEGPYIDSPSPTGSVCFLSARYTHAIIDTTERCTLAAHIAHLRSGDQWRIYA